MVALIDDRQTTFFPGETAKHDVEVNTQIFLGSLVTLNAAGLAIPLDSTTVGQTFVGVAVQAADTRTITPVADRVLRVDVRRTGIHELATQDSLANSNIGDPVWGLDDQTVSLTQSVATQPLVGRIGKFVQSDIADVDIFDAGAIAIQARQVVRTITASATALVSDDQILADATLGALIVTLPTAVGNSGVSVQVKKIDSTGLTVTVDGAGAETIDGDLTKIIGSQWTNITVVSDGTAWFIQ